MDSGRIAVIGGGAGGAWLVMACLRAGLQHIDIVEPRAEIGRGLAYSTGNNQHFLNVPAEKMDAGAEPGDPLFVDWLERTHPNVGAFGYAPRGVYGDFLTEAFAAATTGHDVHHHRTTATSIHPAPGGFRVELSNGQKLNVGAVVLALGNLPPEPLAPSLSDPRMVEDPWHLTPANAAGCEHVVVAGTGLTALDAVVTLAGGNDTSSFTLHAGHPFVPPVDRRVDPWNDGGNLIGLRPAAAMRALRRAIDLNDGPDAWRTVVEGARLHTREVWAAWSEDDRRIFWSHAARHWLHRRHRTAPATHALIQRLMAEGRLAISRGRVTGIRQAGDVLRADIDGDMHTADLIVNATGPSLRLDASPLLADLRHRGMIVPDTLRLGIDVTDDCGVRDDRSRPVANLHAIGPLTRGRFFEVTAVPHVRQQGHMLASHLARILLPKQPTV